MHQGNRRVRCVRRCLCLSPTASWVSCCQHSSLIVPHFALVGLCCPKGEFLPIFAQSSEFRQWRSCRRLGCDQRLGCGGRVRPAAFADLFFGSILAPWVRLGILAIFRLVQLIRSFVVQQVCSYVHLLPKCRCAAACPCPVHARGSFSLFFHCRLYFAPVWGPKLAQGSVLHLD